ncbi:MAG: type VI secretion system secreted protein Hcp [Akkermansiaceae bacterium]|jgi:type VI secretion system secreted protein Hcp
MKKRFPKLTKRLAWAGVAAIFATPIFTLSGAVEMFLKLEGIEGESRDSQHKDEIDVLAWSWGVSQSGSFAGGFAGRASFQDLSLTKYIDKASPSIMYRVFTGQQIPKAELFMTKAGAKGNETFMTITMEPVLVSSYSTGGSGGEDRFTENLSLNYGKVTIEYRKQNETGVYEPGIKAGWDLQQNKATETP